MWWVGNNVCAMEDQIGHVIHVKEGHTTSTHIHALFSMGVSGSVYGVCGCGCGRGCVAGGSQHLPF